MLHFGVMEIVNLYCLLTNSESLNSSWLLVPGSGTKASLEENDP